MKQRIELVVRAIILNKDKHILLTKRANQPELGKWCLPGGKVKFHETLENAIKREIKEELKLFIKPIFIKYSEDFKSVTNNHCTVFYFKGIAKGKIKIKRDEILDTKYFSKQEIKNSPNIAFDHKEVILRIK